MKKYFALETSGNEADIYIFGDITSWEWFDSDVSSYTLSQQIKALDVDMINVHINSYGGEVAEGLAIHNVLVGHKAKVRTVVDGFACSAASAIFMAGDERIMHGASLLMIHNAWMSVAGNAEDLRKEADDLDLITDTMANVYLDRINITADELKAMLDAETWIPPEEALEKGFATEIRSTGSAGEKTLNRWVARMKDPPTNTTEQNNQELPEESEQLLNLEEPQAPAAQNKILKFLGELAKEEEK